MDKRIERFFNGMKDKKVAFCGIGRSNLPLIKLFKKYGASVIACDRRGREQLGENADIAEQSGAILSLGEDYLKNLDIDMSDVFIVDETTRTKKDNDVLIEGS